MPSPGSIQGWPLESILKTLETAFLWEHTGESIASLCNYGVYVITLTPLPFFDKVVFQKHPGWMVQKACPISLCFASVRYPPAFYGEPGLVQDLRVDHGIASFRIGDIHGSNQRTFFDFNRLDSNLVFNTRRKYYITI